MLERDIVELIVSANFPNNIPEVDHLLDRIFTQRQRESYAGTCIEHWQSYVAEDPEALAAFRRLTEREHA